MHVHKDLLTAMVDTLYKNEARIKQLGAALAYTPSNNNDWSDYLYANERFKWRTKYATLIDPFKRLE